MSNRPLLAPILAALTLTLGACGSAADESPSVFDQDRAEVLLAAEFPGASIEVLALDDATSERALASVRLDEGDVKVSFVAGDGGWSIEAIEQGGVRYTVEDLRGIAATVEALSLVSGALQRYREATGEFPALPDLSGLQLLVPDYLDDDAALRDAWERGFRYSRQGSEYTMTSDGPDGEPRTPDDLIVVTGRFVAEQP